MNAENSSSTLAQEEIARRFHLLRENASRMKSSSAAERIKMLKKLLRVVQKHTNQITDALKADYGRHPIETSMADIWVVIKEIKFAIRNLEEWMADKTVPTSLLFFGSSSRIQYESKGVVLIISPWNFPFNLSLSPLVSAIAAGNTVIIKPSEFTKNSSKLLKSIVDEAFEENVAQVVEGGKDEVVELLRFPFNHIFFTGSQAVGKIVMKAAAENLTSVTLELGGKTPVIIDDSADLKSAARMVVYGKFNNNGQICIAANHVLVQDSIADAFIQAVKKEVKKLYGQDQIQKNEDYARLVSDKHFQRIKQLSEEAVEQGAKLETKANFISDERFVAPIVLSKVNENMGVDKEEIFGPILPIRTFDSISEVIAKINKGTKPLAIYMFSKRKKDVKKVLAETSSGAFVQNEMFLHHFNSHLPFGGINNSGIGKSHGYFGFLEFTNQKAVVKQWSPIHASKLLHPPYNNFSKRLVNLVMKFFS